MFSKTLKTFLDKNKMKYEIIEHRTVYTALDKAATLRVKPATIGKTVIVSLDGKNYALGLIPANKNLDKKKLLKAMNAWLKKQKPEQDSHGRPPSPRLRRASNSHVRNSHEFPRFAYRYSHADFVTEKWMKANIKGVKLGATPPLGILYKLPFFIDNSLAKQPKIIVNAGEYKLSLKVSPASLIKLDPNTVKGSFSMAKK